MHAPALRFACGLGLATLFGCSAPKLAANEEFAPDLELKTLPSGAEVRRDGKLIGATPLHVKLAQSPVQVVLDVTHPGFIPAKVEFDQKAAFLRGGGESWVALKPESLGTDTKDIDGNSPKDLARAATSLVKAKRCPEAMQFVERALAIDPLFGRPWRERARCLAREGQRRESVDAMQRYLLLDPDAADAPAIRKELEALSAKRDIDASDPLKKKPEETE